MKRTDHDEFDAMAVGWALHALEPDEEQAFAEHLATCGRCQRLVQDAEESLADLAYNVPMVDPPPQVLDRIRQATGSADAKTTDPLRVEQSVAPVVPLPARAARAARQLPRWVMPAVAAGLVLIALLGWNVVLQSRVDEARQTAAERQSVIDELGRSSTRAVLTDSSNRTVGYVLQRGSSVTIAAGGLAPNDRANSTYVLWAIQGSGAPPRAVGTFDVVRTSMDVRAVGGSPPAPGSFSGFAVSRELGRSVPQRPSQIVATGAVLS